MLFVGTVNIPGEFHLKGGHIVLEAFTILNKKYNNLELAGVFLDAISYELPVITTDVHANPELVEDGKTGLLIERSSKVPYYMENWIAPGVGDKSDFSKAIKVLDEAMVADLVEKTSLLMEDKELRRQMSKTGR